MAQAGRVAGPATLTVSSGDRVFLPAISIAAFWQSPEAEAALSKLPGDRRCEATDFELFAGGIDAAIRQYRDTPTPDLLVIEEGTNHAAFIRALAALAEVCLEVTRVVVVGKRNDVAVYRDLVAAGVSDYLLLPVDVNDFAASVARIFPDGPNQRRGKVVSFIGVRGGAGSSVIAHNTAWQIATHLETGVLLVDLDFAFGTASLNFDIPGDHDGVLDALRSMDALDRVLLDRLAAAPQARLKVLGHRPRLEVPVADLGKSCRDLILALQRTVDLTMLDLPTEWSGVVKNAIALSDEIVLTAVPELDALRSAKVLVREIQAMRPNDPPPRLVLNAIGLPRRPQIEVAKFCETLEMTPLAVLPYDGKRFGMATNEGLMLDQAGASRRITDPIRKIARSVTGHAAPSETRGGWLRRGVG